MGNQILEKKIYKLREYIDQLSPYMPLSNKEILANTEKRYSMERIFQLMVDEAIDINQSILYSTAKKVPDSYKSSFYDLVSIKVIEQSFADQISGSAGLRNNIIHEYDKMQDVDIISDIKKFFPLYKEYAQLLVAKYVQS